MVAEFSWTKQWYPVIPISYLDSSHPTSITLLGKKLVIWRDKHQHWVAMDDTCPHKLAQLSLGTINEHGDLMCRHHGWCFDGTGKCTKIPMLSDGPALENACNSERSHVKTYPTQVVQELLWIWADNCSTAFEDCSAKHPTVIPELELSTSSIEWFMLEVPVGYTISVESSFDPSHAQFLHAGIAGFSPERAVPIQRFELSGEVSAEAGFTLKHSGYNIFNKDMDATRKFTPPCCNTTTYKYPNGKSTLFQLYFIPTKPGFCKYINTFIADDNPLPKRSFYFKLLPNYLQTGLVHSLLYQLNNQDLSMMHSQAVNESIGNKTWQKSYFMASLADVGIVTFRKWLDEFAKGKPAWQGVTEAPFQELSDQQLYDTWHRHSKHCPSCRQSLVAIDKFKDFLQNLTAALAVLALLLIATNLPTRIILIPILVGTLSLIFSYQLTSMRERFISSIPKKGLPIITLY